MRKYRNKKIAEMHMNGISKLTIASIYKLSISRVTEIIRENRIISKNI